MWGETDWDIEMDMYPLRKSGENERVTGRKSRGLQTGNNLQVSDIFTSLKWQEETN